MVSANLNKITQSVSAAIHGLQRNVDRRVEPDAARRERCQHWTGLRTASASKFRDDDVGGREVPRETGGAPLEDALIRPR